MKILLFGGTGQVGQALQARCAMEAPGRAEVDLRDPDAIAASVGRSGADVVINCAAWTAVDAAEEAEAEAQVVNAAAPGAMARSAAQAGIPLVHLSTDYVFSGKQGRPWQEDDPVGPLGVYGRTKLAGEVAVRELHPHHLIVRTAWVHAAGGANFVSTMLRLAKDREALQVVDDQVGSPTHAGHLADALIALLPRFCADPKLGGTLHMAGEGQTSWAGLAREIFAQAGLPVAVMGIPSSAWPTPAQRPPWSVLDMGRLEARFGLRLPPWQEGVAAHLGALDD
jgi:dTDP-4-dehydrorhamnose reductase